MIRWDRYYKKICQKILFATNFETDTKVKTIFNTLVKFCAKKAIPLNDILAVASDGVPAMTGRHKGVIAYLKNKVPDVQIHSKCIYLIHRHYLIAKKLSERLHMSLQYSLIYRLLSQLRIANDEDFNRSLLHTEVRWLS